MTVSITLTPGGKAQIVNLGDAPFAVLVDDDDLPAGLPTLTYGARMVSGLPVTVTLPSWATHCQVLGQESRSLLLPAGQSYIGEDDLPFDAGETTQETFIRGVEVVGGEIVQKGLAVRRNLIWRAPAPETPVVARMTLSGDVALNTTSVVGSVITATSLPNPSRPPSAFDHEIWVYNTADAVLDTAPISTANFVSGTTTVPTDDAKYFEIVYQAFDPVFNEWVRRRSARYDIATTSASGPITQGMITWTNSWILVNNLRQLVRAEFDIAGIIATNEVQWRINCERYQTGWANCPVVSGARRTFGDILCPAGHPHSGMKLNEFLPQLQDMFTVEFRWRPVAGTGAWAQTAPGPDNDAAWIRVPLPSGSGQQFNRTPTTVAALRTAIIDGGAASGLFLVGLAGTYSAPGSSLQFDDINKAAGGPLVITSIDRNAPANFNGSTGLFWQFVESENFILDRFNIHNDQTQTVGWPPTAPMVTKNSIGYGTQFRGCQRFYVQNISYDRLSVGQEFRDCDWFYSGFCRWNRTYEDGWRVRDRASNVLFEGEDHLPPDIYPLLIDATDQSVNPYPPRYHPDVCQIWTTNTRYPSGARTGPRALGGVRGFRRVNFRQLGLAPGDGVHRYSAGYWGNEFIRTNTPANAVGGETWEMHLHHDWEVRGGYIESQWNGGVVVQQVDGMLLKDCVFRDTSPGQRNLSCLIVQTWVQNIRIENVVSPYGKAHSGITWAMPTATQLANVEGNATISATAWPAGWTGGANRFPYGPDAYREAA